MVIVQALLAALSRSAGRLLNTAFGWATAMLFGKVPQDRQLYLSGITLGAVVWLVALVAIAVPEVGTFLLAFVPLPEWVDENWVRIAMLAVVVLMPALVGWLSTRLVPAEERRQRGISTWGAVLRGYPYTVGLALTLVLMTIFAPILKVRNVIRRWATQHVPVIIEPDAYPDVVSDVENALGRAGMATERQLAPWILRFPTRILTLLAGRAVSTVTAKTLTRLVGEQVELLLHPSDIVISGREREAVRARSALAEHLTYTRAYLTWDKDANEIEDELREVWRDLAAGHRRGLKRRLADIEERLRHLAVPYEEWEVLFRQLLLVYRAVADHAVIPRPRLGTIFRAIAVAAPVLKQAADLAHDMQSAEDGLRARDDARVAEHAGTLQEAARRLGRAVRRRRTGGRLQRFLRRVA